MSWVIRDEEKLRDLPLESRLQRCEDILKHDKDQSKRWDAVWLVGEIAREAGKGPLFDKAAELLAWDLANDNDGVVKHEVCYQISACDMRDKIPDMVEAGLRNESALARHEAIECLGSMEAFEVKENLKEGLKDPIPYVRETAAFAIKRLERMERRKGQYNLSEIL